MNVVASPRVNALNNEPAIMRVGTQDVFFKTTSQVDATTGRILQTTVEPQAITEGVVLSVTFAMVLTTSLQKNVPLVAKRRLNA